MKDLRLAALEDVAVLATAGATYSELMEYIESEIGKCNAAPAIEEMGSGGLQAALEGIDSRAMIDLMRNALKQFAAYGYENARAVTVLDQLKFGLNPTGLALAAIGREHFGNPIPKEWYIAARELLALGAQPKMDILRNALKEFTAHGYDNSRTLTALDKLEVAFNPSGLALAAIGREHFGNPIPQEWYLAARELLALGTQPKEKIRETVVDQFLRPRQRG